VSKRRQGQRIYLVERVALLAWIHTGLPSYAPCDSDDGESYVPVRAFSERKAAEAYRAELEKEARAELSPALFCDYLAPKGLAARLRSFKLEPPKFSKGSNAGLRFRQWWVEHGADLTAEQRDALWELFPDVSFYRVTAKALG
jgi:hypothetical protein